MMTIVNTYQYNCRIITMEPNPVCGVGVVKLSLQRLQIGVTPGCSTQTHLLDDPTDVKVAKVLAQPLGEILQSWLLLLALFVLECMRQGKRLEE